MFAARFGDGWRRHLPARSTARVTLTRAVYAIDARMPMTYKMCTPVIHKIHKINFAGGKARLSANPGPASDTMKSEILQFNELLENVRQASARAGSIRRASRSNEINALTVKRLRGWTRLSQPEFARLLGVELGTLRNWEQGRREPTGPARALLRAICNDPEHVLLALRSAGKRRGSALRRREAAA
jgi:putative transcriptional regulator